MQNDLNKIFVTVYTTVFNGGLYLKETIQSILNQTHQNFEYLIVNDGSTDNTEAIIKGFNDCRIIYHKLEENIGNRKAANFAIDLAKGKYLFRMDADDLSVTKRLQESIEFLETHPDIGLFGGQLALFGNETGIWNYPTTEDDIKFKRLFGTPVAQPVSAIRLDVLNTNKLRYNVDGLSYAEDLEFFNRILNYTKPANSNNILLKYRRHPQNITRILKHKGRELNTPVFKLILRNFSLDNLTDADIRIHLLLSKRFMHDFTVNDITQIKTWCSFLKMQNRKIHYMHTSQFDLRIDKMWDSLYYVCKNKNHATLKEYIKKSDKKKTMLWLRFLKEKIIKR